MGSVPGLETLTERPATARRKVARLADGVRALGDDPVAVEAPVALLYNGESHVVMMATPRDLTDFAVGFSLAEGIVADAGEIRSVLVEPTATGMCVTVAIPDDRARALAFRRRNLEGRTGCGLCGVSDIDEALRPLAALPPSRPVPASAIAATLAALPERQTLNRETGAVHAAAFADRTGTISLVREDVGRHNALDKLIGAAARESIDPLSGFVVVTSRCSMEMVQKTVTFGCPILVAISAPTSLAIELAERANLTVAAFARGQRVSLYAHPERIA